MVYHRIVNVVPCAVQGTLLSIQSICNYFYTYICLCSTLIEAGMCNEIWCLSRADEVRSLSHNMRKYGIISSDALYHVTYLNSYFLCLISRSMPLQCSTLFRFSVSFLHYLWVSCCKEVIRLTSNLKPRQWIFLSLIMRNNDLPFLSPFKF